VSATATRSPKYTMEWTSPIVDTCVLLSRIYTRDMPGNMLLVAGNMLPVSRQYVHVSLCIQQQTGNNFVTSTSNMLPGVYTALVVNLRTERPRKPRKCCSYCARYRLSVFERRTFYFLPDLITAWNALLGDLRDPTQSIASFRIR